MNLLIFTKKYLFFQKYIITLFKQTTLHTYFTKASYTNHMDLVAYQEIINLCSKWPYMKPHIFFSMIYYLINLSYYQFSTLPPCQYRQQTLFNRGYQFIEVLLYKHPILQPSKLRSLLSMNSKYLVAKIPHEHIKFNALDIHIIYLT